jgi:inner membrane protein
MDNITHTLTGLMMARAGLGRTTERGGTLMLMLAANTPDLDVFLGLPGGLAYLEYHRGYAHSLALAPAMALIPLLLAHWIRGASITWKTWLACLLGVLSHLVLDLTNVYGVRIFLPFSERWVHWDFTEIIDPWILLIFFIAIAAPALSGLVGSEIRGRKAEGPKRAWAWIALFALLGYEGFRFAARQRAVAVMSARLYQGEPARHLAAVPSGFNPLHWRGVIQMADSVLTAPVDLTEEFDPGLGEVDYPAPVSPALEAARGTAQFQVFLRFNQLPFWKATPVDDAIRVDLIDLRFGTPRSPGFASATAIVSADGHVRDVRFGMGLPGRRP